jgi:hypothetical protein
MSSSDNFIFACPGALL